MGFEYRRPAPTGRDVLATQVRGTVVQFQNTYSVDAANDLRFVSLGAESSSRGERSVRHYNLLWRGHAIVIEGDYGHVRTERGFSLLLRVDAMRIPTAAGVDVDTVRHALSEAFATYIGGMEETAYVAQVALPAAIEWV